MNSHAACTLTLALLLTLPSCSSAAPPECEEVPARGEAQRMEAIAAHALTQAREAAPSLALVVDAPEVTSAFDEARGLWVAERFSNELGEAPTRLSYTYVTTYENDEMPTSPRSAFTARENLITQASTIAYATLGLVPLVRLSSSFIYLYVEENRAYAFLLDGAMEHATFLSDRAFAPTTSGLRTVGLESVQRSPDNRTLLLGGYAGPPDEVGSESWFWAIPVDASLVL